MSDESAFVYVMGIVGAPVAMVLIFAWAVMVILAWEER